MSNYPSQCGPAGPVERDAVTDVADLVCCLAESVIEDMVFSRNGPTHAEKQQLRDALNKLIDERVAAALHRATLGEGIGRSG